MNANEENEAARDLLNCGCGCDEDAKDGCPNFNGERCTWQECLIGLALLEARIDGLKEALGILPENASYVVSDRFDWNDGYNTGAKYQAKISRENIENRIKEISK